MNFELITIKFVNVCLESFFSSPTGRMISVFSLQFFFFSKDNFGVSKLLTFDCWE